MKTITLHAPAIDNLGQFCDAGAELVVGAAAEAGTIDGDRAKQLVANHAAVGHHAAAPTPPTRG